ncbi:MAG: PAS domain S-box protein [Dermatophilaceae bacterium]
MTIEQTLLTGGAPPGTFAIGEIAAAVLAQADVYAWVVDDAGCYVWVSDRLAEILDRSPISLIGEPASPDVAPHLSGIGELQPGDPRADVTGPRRVATVVAGAGRAHCLEGIVFPVSGAGGLHLTGGAFTDSAGSAGSGQHVADALDDYHDLFAHAGAPMVVLDRRGGIVESNVEARALIGLSADDIVGVPFTAFLSKDRGTAMLRAYNELAPGVSRLFADEVVYRPDGTMVRCRATVSRLPVRGASNRYALAVVTGVRVEREDHGKDLRPIEREVLCHVAAGATTAKVAGLTHLSRQGVDYNLRTLMDRFGVGNRAELVARAYTLGVLSPTSWPPRIAEPARHSRFAATGPAPLSVAE